MQSAHRLSCAIIESFLFVFFKYAALFFVILHLFMSHTCLFLNIAMRFFVFLFELMPHIFVLHRFPEVVLNDSKMSFEP